ncbi:hypothetical protein [Levilactobacillus acidifarinae]|uniref:Uncharacterized protein n=1 Tax=Levilactobacillus acidifarinae DSM 19394 = JCM 15949 TaxID=1423715 RepID=A0A0R1LKP4_9LACO|nr:hypothetical protein [Levilactobacillus acidifarinae]KRK94067.1 hypothetical protein FD25_GL001398 [Levilactobacillus acidifarinae DSM 19394]GEO69766.1 hypothetical protein LAC03_16760 [Levilactobacillus acidifarinae]
MTIVHILAEIGVFFAAISLIYYFFQITQAQGDRRKNLRNVGIAIVVLLIAYPVSNLAGKKDVSPTNQISNQVKKVKKQHQDRQRESSRSSESTSESTSSAR